MMKYESWVHHLFVIDFGGLVGFIPEFLRSIDGIFLFFLLLVLFSKRQPCLVGVDGSSHLNLGYIPLVFGMHISFVKVASVHLISFSSFIQSF